MLVLTSFHIVYLKVRGHASDDMNIDSVMSSSTCKRNSALLHCSCVDSILLGLSSQDWWRDSNILKWGCIIWHILFDKIYNEIILTSVTDLWMVGWIAVCRKSVHTLFMYLSMIEVVKLSALKRVLVSVSRSTSSRLRADKSSASFRSNLQFKITIIIAFFILF